MKGSGFGMYETLLRPCADPQVGVLAGQGEHAVDVRVVLQHPPEARAALESSYDSWLMPMTVSPRGVGELHPLHRPHLGDDHDRAGAGRPEQRASARPACSRMLASGGATAGAGGRLSGVQTWWSGTGVRRSSCAILGAG